MGGRFWGVEGGDANGGWVFFRDGFPSRDWAWLSLWVVRGIGVENRESGIGKSGVENRESEGLKRNGLIHGGLGG